MSVKVIADRFGTPREKVMPNIFVEQMRIWYALMMHDIKSRFFGNGFGYLVTMLWPFVHILIILGINAGRLPPHGPSMVLYAATAVIPYIAANYIGRFIIMSVIVNKSFLHYPLIKPLDLMIARTILELVSNFFVVGAILLGMALLGIDVRPVSIDQAMMAWGAAMFLGVGFGFMNGVITLAYPMWHLIFVLFIIIAWITCGIGIDPEALPEQYGYYFSFNPVMHAVEWMRVAYYPDYRPRLLDKAYLIEVALASLWIGLIVERSFRAFLLQQR